jgi:surface antigen
VPRALRALASLTCLLLVSAFGVGVSALPASATIDRLCYGFEDCRLSSKPNAGYRAHLNTMYWRMYAGHNCTNYAAYRMVRSGLANSRPWDGAGNAEYWGVFKAGITNQTPRVGAVAWWRANVPGAGSAGHVAYVERVVSADQIIVSQDSWHGDFSWATITRDGRGGWPSGFVHFNDVPLLNTALPAVSGAPEVGAELTASHGSWTPGRGTAYAYRWRANGVPIEGATGTTFVVGPAQEGKRISVRVTASKLGYPTTSAFSAPTAAVAAGDLAGTNQPRVIGEAKVDATLTATSGTWSPTPTRLTYQWRADGQPILDATNPTFTPGPAQVGKALTVTVTASRDGYDDESAISEPTDAVAPGTLTRASAAVVTGVPRLGETLQVDPGTFTPEDATVSVQWLRAGIPIEGATESTYLLTRADLGSRIAARVWLTKPGYTRLRSHSAATRRVKSPPTLRVRTEPGTGRLRAAVTVTALGVRPVPGTVRVRSGARVLGTLVLREGAAATTLRSLPRGLRTFRFRYTGTEKVAATSLSRTVRIG